MTNASRNRAVQRVSAWLLAAAMLLTAANFAAGLSHHLGLLKLSLLATAVFAVAGALFGAWAGMTSRRAP